MTTVPTVQVLKVVETKWTRCITIKCPHCGRKHVHGWPYGQPDIGHRIGHCLYPRPRPDSQPGYYVALPVDPKGLAP